MPKDVFKAWLIAFFLLFLSLTTSADEGMWLLDSIDQLPIDSLKAWGLKLNPAEIYNPKGAGIADAVAKVNGSSGSFVSSQGLIITNHHVAFSAVQRQSTLEHNYLQEGFFAPTREEELPAIGYYVDVTQAFEDVTSRVLGALEGRMSDLERNQAMEKISKKIIREAERKRDVKCELVSTYGGNKYYLYTYFRIRDVRLVYAPPRSIGDYGGEIDNWMWPRHAGDFSFLRAYVAPNGKSAQYSKKNVPYKSRTYLKISSAGIKEGDFVMVMGFPRITRRYESSFSVDKTVKHDYPLEIQTRRELISILEEASAADSSVAIKLSSRIKGLNNYFKKYQGVLEGFKRARILENKMQQERALSEFLSGNPKLEKRYGDVLTGLDSLFNAYLKFQDKSFVLSWMSSECNFLSFASTLYKWSLEREKKDENRELGYQDRDTADTRRWLQDAQISLVPSVDKQILIYFLKKATQLPSNQKIVAVETVLKGTEGRSADKILAGFTDDLYQKTKLGSKEERLKMFGMSRRELEKDGDSFIVFAKQLEAEREDLRNKDKEFSGALTRLEPKLIEAYAAWRGKDLYPDANGTIRFNYGKVRGYVPRDAVTYKYVTTLSGVLEKNTGEEPFDAPQEIKNVYLTKDFGKYLDIQIGDVPVDFLSTNDITNGNSGSPVMNGRGELVGLAFDGNYESVSSDYLFEPELTRSLNVDIRYVLFLLDKVYHADSLLKELSIR
ncbi:MAG: S46 family peptidase [Candidatus Zixiibacteriota bacterium]